MKWRTIEKRKPFNEIVVHHCIKTVQGKVDLNFLFLFYRCGQGSLFKSDAGFITTGKVALSPVFEMFRTAGGNTMKYDCSFVVCRTPCDGVSNLNKSK